MLREKVIDRVRNLLAKTTENGASQDESRSAVEAAERIMAKYHLSEEDLAHEPADDYAKVDAADFDQIRSFVGSRFYCWEADLAGFVAKFVGVPHYSDPDPMPARKNGVVQLDEDDEPIMAKSFVFYGVSEDAELARHLFDELRLLVASMAVAKWGGVYKGDGAAYAEGFVLALFDKLRTAKQEEKSSAESTAAENPGALTLISRRDDLIKYKRDRAKDWLKKEKGIELVSGRGHSGSRGSSEAFSSGQRDGSRTDVSAARRRKIGI